MVLAQFRRQSSTALTQSDATLAHLSNLPTPRIAQPHASEVKEYVPGK
jgi:hypothetical protein